jgi:hypothetical protein
MDSQLESILFDGNWKTCAEGNEIGLHVGGETEFGKAAALPDPVGQYVQKVADNARSKNSSVADAGWDEPLTRTSGSRQRFENVVAKLFAGHPEEQAEALALAERAVAECCDAVRAA